MAKIDNYKDLKTHKTKNIFLLLGPDTGSKETYIKKIISNIDPTPVKEIDFIKKRLSEL